MTNIHDNKHLDDLFDEIENMIDYQDDMWHAEQQGKINVRDRIKDQYDVSKKNAHDAFKKAVRIEVANLLRNKVDIII
jgi:hypothetical protein